MLIKYLVEEDVINYKKCSMFLGFPFCTFKCDKENGTQLCQNMPLIHQPNLETTAEAIYNKYINNTLTKAIVCGGLEPLESFDDLYNLIVYFRQHNCNDEFVIYTGYTEDEIQNNEKWKQLFDLSNIIIKFGRFRPNEKSHYDEVLGINLVSNNQYAKRFN